MMRENDDARLHTSASNSSTRTVADPAFGFGNRQSRSGEKRRRFLRNEPNPLSSSDRSVEGEEAAATIESSTGKAGDRREAGTASDERHPQHGQGCRRRVDRRERWRTWRTTSKVTKAEAVRTGCLLLPAGFEKSHSAPLEQGGSRCSFSGTLGSEVPANGSHPDNFRNHQVGWKVLVPLHFVVAAAAPLVVFLYSSGPLAFPFSNSRILFSVGGGPCRQVLRIHAKDLLFYFCRCALVMPSPPASSISVVTEHAGATPRLVMSKTTFKVWLAAAHVTNDPVGDFISDARQDAQLPETFTSAAQLRGYMRTRHASLEVLATVPAIWRRFELWRDQRRCRNRKRENRETGKASGGRRDYSND